MGTAFSIEDHPKVIKQVNDCPDEDYRPSMHSQETGSWRPTHRLSLSMGSGSSEDMLRREQRQQPRQSHKPVRLPNHAQESTSIRLLASVSANLHLGCPSPPPVRGDEPRPNPILPSFLSRPSCCRACCRACCITRARCMVAAPLITPLPSPPHPPNLGPPVPNLAPSHSRVAPPSPLLPTLPSRAIPRATCPLWPR